MMGNMESLGVSVAPRENAQEIKNMGNISTSTT